MATLYPSLEDMKGHQILQVSVSAVAFQGASRPPPPPGSLGLGGAQPGAHPVSRQAQAAAGVRTPPTTVVTEKPKLDSGTGNAGCHRLSLSRGCLRVGGAALTGQGGSAETPPPQLWP